MATEKVKVTKPEWAVGLFFKHESMIRGVAIGPVHWIGKGVRITLDKAKAARMEPLVRGEDGRAEWLQLPVVYKLAKSLGIEVQEF